MLADTPPAYVWIAESRLCTFFVAEFCNILTYNRLQLPSIGLNTPLKESVTDCRSKDCENSSEQSRKSREGPSQEKIYEWAKQTLSLLNDGFQWKDTALIIKSCLEFSAEFPLLGVDEKRVVAIQMFDDLIDLTDTPYLPDSYTDPLFKAIVPLFVNLLIPDSARNEEVPHLDKLDLSSIRQTVQNILSSFDDGFQWKDLAELSQLAIFFSEQYPLLPPEDKATMSKQIVDGVINETDTPYLIDAVSDPIFKAIIHPIIDTYFQL